MYIAKIENINPKIGAKNKSISKNSFKEIETIYLNWCKWLDAKPNEEYKSFADGYVIKIEKNL